MHWAAVLLVNLAAVAASATIVWLISLRRKDAGVVDIFWGLGFVMIAWVTFGWSDAQAARAMLLCVLTTVWGLRLAGYLTWRNLGREEDYRYREMRDKHGSRFPLVSLFTVFWLQAAIMWVVSLPLQLGQLADSPWNLLDLCGVACWSIGFLFESVGDYQLARFKARPENRGAVMDRGLWRYTRHPNYFGDCLVWWGLFLIAAGGGAWPTVISPLLMSFLLMKVSGVALLERSITDRRPEYAAYIRSTSPFFPLPPRSPRH